MSFFNLNIMNASVSNKDVTPHIGRYANILLDDWFKRTFVGGRDRKRLLLLFLRELIPDRSIETISYGPQEAVNPNPRSKGIRLDIECTDAGGDRFLVELQRAPQDDFYQRAVFNSTFGVQRQIPSGDGYSFAPVYFIGIMDFTLHPGDDRFYYRYSLTENKSGELMTDRLNYIFLELPKCGKEPEASVLEKFGYALHNMYLLENVPEGFEGEIFRLLFESAEISTFTPEEKIAYTEDMTTERDIRNQIAYARKEGRAEGRAEGKAEGANQEKLEIARKMVSMKLEASVISEATGLSEEEIATL